MPTHTYVFANAAQVKEYSTISFSSTDVSCSPQTTAVVPVVNSSSMGFDQHNILASSQPNGCIPIVSDANMSSPITTLGVVESVATTVTSISGLPLSTIAANEGVYTHFNVLYMYVCTINPYFNFSCITTKHM